MYVVDVVDVVYDGYKAHNHYYHHITIILKGLCVCSCVVCVCVVNNVWMR